jgi:hypothetical protein
MKTFTPVFLLLLTLSCTPKSLPTVFEAREGFALLKASHEITKTELQQIKEDLAVMGFDMDYSKSQFFEDGKIQRLTISVLTPEGAAGSTSADLVTLQYKYYGFRYDKQGESLLYLGIME